MTHADLGNVFDEPNLAQVDDLPTCCVCGRTISGLRPEQYVGVDCWYCPKCSDGSPKTGQGELKL